MKFVLNGLSNSGCPSSATFSLRIIHAILRASVRMVCSPSSSYAAVAPPLRHTTTLAAGLKRSSPHLIIQIVMKGASGTVPTAHTAGYTTLYSHLTYIDNLSINTLAIQGISHLCKRRECISFSFVRL
jgi:hypothetical protein